MALKSARGALLRKVLPLSIHDQPYIQVDYSPVGEEHKTYQARIGIESAYEGMAAGDQVVIHSLMNVVTRIEKT